MKTIIAIPAMNTVPTQFAASLALLRRDEDTVVGFKMGSLVYMSRNDLAKAAIQMEADVVLWLDSDMVFEPDTLERLLKDYNEGKGDIISGLYFKRVPPYTPVIHTAFDKTAEGWFYSQFSEEIPSEPFEVAGCGFGCVLTPVKVLKAVGEKYGPPFNPIDGHGEDLCFCWRARQLGFKIVCDPTIQCGHVGYQVVTKSYYDQIMGFGGNNGSNT